jgi:heptaprenyl diphosphate synthase
VAAGTAPEGSDALLALLEGDLVADDSLAEAVRQLRVHPATEQAREVALHWADMAVASLAPLPDLPATRALAALAQALADRPR